MKWLSILLAVMAIVVVLGVGVVTPTATLDGASRVNVRGIVVDENTGKPVEDAHIEFRFGPGEPTDADAFSGTDGSFILVLEHWGLYGYEYFFLWTKYYYDGFCLKVSADGYDEIVMEYVGMPHDPYNANADDIDAGTVSLNPSEGAPAD